MRFEDLAFVAFLLAMVFLVYQELNYPNPDGAPGAMNDLIYRNGQDRIGGVVLTANRRQKL